MRWFYGVTFSPGTGARDGVQEQDFPWLAASLAAPLALLTLEFLLGQVVGEILSPPTETPRSGLLLGELLVMLTHALGVAAAMTIAVAALCFSKNWGRGLWDLAKRLLVFRIMVYVTTLILLEIGIVGPIISGVLHRILDFHIPEWIGEFADQVSYAGVMSVIYLAVIGATWTVCRRSFGELLASGEVTYPRDHRENGRGSETKTKEGRKAREKGGEKSAQGRGEKQGLNQRLAVSDPGYRCVPTPITITIRRPMARFAPIQLRIVARVFAAPSQSASATCCSRRG